VIYYIYYLKFVTSNNTEEENRLTIKRRLLISNFLMLVMPMVMTIVISVCAVLVVMGITGVNDFKSLKDGRTFDNAISEVDVLSGKWSSNSELSKVRSDIDSFNKKYNENQVFLFIYDGNNLIYPSSSTYTAPIDKVLLQEEKYIVIVNNTAIYKTTTDQYTVILACDNYALNNHKALGNYYYLGILLPISLIIIICFINRALTKFVFKSIITPIDILVYGVNQIRDGNLAYRIEYDKKDEFAQICSDFNDMAYRLSDMVDARQKDELSRRELIAGISHDLRTPLTSIKAYVEGIEKGVASTPQVQKHYFETIKSKTSDLEYIINQLFLFSKLDVGEFPLYMEEVDIGEDISKLVNVLRNEYEQKGLSIHLNRNIQNVFVNIDVIQFHNVIQNILENSSKYKIEEAGVVETVCIEEASKVVITLTDNGPGVPSESIEKLFDLFYRSDASRKNPSNGSGIGLATAKKIINMMNGEIRAKNVVNGGLAIIITLPIVKRGDKIEKNTNY